MPPVEADFRISIDPRSLTQATNQANGFDRALLSARDAVGDLEKTLNRLDAQIDLEVDDSAVQRVRATMDSIEDTSVTIHANTQDIDAALRTLTDLNANTTFTANVNTEELTNAAGIREDLEQNTSFTAGVQDQRLTQAKNKHDALGENVSSDVNVTVSGDTDTLDQLADLGGTIDLTVNIATTGANLAGGAIGLLGIGELAETEAALVELQYTTGQTVEGAEELADSLFLANWGESRAEILDLIGAATLLKVEADDLESALTSAFQTSATTGFEMEETLRAQQSLVKNGLVPDFETAGVIIRAAFQSGTNVGDDLLDTINEYSSTFSGLGFTAEQTLSTLNSGLAAGADNTDRVADAVREFGIKAREGTDEFRAAIEQLDLTDVYESFLAGETTGAEFFDQLTNELGQVKEMADAAAIATATIGTQSEDFTVDVIANIDVDQDQLQAIAAATSSVDLIGTDLNSQIEEFSRFAETEIHEALRNAFNIQEFVDNAKAAIEGFFTTLESGGSIGEALGVAIDVLNIPILEDFQQTLSELAIGFLQAAREIIGILPGNQGESSLDNLIRELGTEQFKIDVALADDGSEMSSALQTAIDRGVHSDHIANALEEQFHNALAAGNFQDAVNLEALFRNLPTLENVVLPVGFDAGVLSGELRAAYDTAIQAAFVEGDASKLGDALNAALALGDTDIAAQLSDTISFVFTEALLDGDLAAAASVSSAIPTVIADLQAQLEAVTSEGDTAAIANITQEIALLQDSLALFEGVDYEPPVTEEDAAAVEAANETMAQSTEESTERTTAAVTEQREVHDSEHSAMQQTETDTADVTERAGQDVIETYGLTEAEIRRLSQVATTEFPRVSTAFNTMAQQVDQYEDLMVAAINRIRQAILSLPTLPAVPGATGTTPAPTPGTTPAPGAPIPGGIGGADMAMPFFSPMMGGGGSTTNNYNVTSNQVFHTQSKAADIAMLAQATARTLRKF